RSALRRLVRAPPESRTCRLAVAVLSWPAMGLDVAVHGGGRGACFACVEISVARASTMIARVATAAPARMAGPSQVPTPPAYEQASTRKVVATPSPSSDARRNGG